MIKYFHAIPVFFLFASFSAGILAAWYFGMYIGSLAIIVLITTLYIFAVITYNKNKLFFYSLLLLIFLFGFLRQWIALFSFDQSEYNLFRSDITSVQGSIVDTRYRDQKADLYLLECDSVHTVNGAMKADGFIGLHQGKYKSQFSYGDYVKIDQQPRQIALPSNPGEFNYRYYFQLKDQFFSLRIDKNTSVKIIKSDQGDLIQKIIFNPVRDKIRAIINHNLPDRSAGIVNALILGDRSNLNAGVITDFQKTGVIHVLAISGLHVGFIALIVQFILTLLRLPAKLNISLTIVFLAFFVALVDFKAPVVRASLMLTIYYLTKFINRPQDPINVIAIAGLVILFFQPEQLLLPGFQYSFAAVFGLIYGGKRLNKVIPALHADNQLKKFFNKYLRSAFIASLCAVLATLPLTWYYYGTIQIGALLANVFVIPVIGLVVFLSIFLLIISLINFLPVAGIALLLHAILNSLVHFISFFASIPFIQLTAGQPGLFLLLLSIVLVLGIFNINRVNARLATFSSLAIIIFYLFFFSPLQNNLRLTFIHVGQGDACLIQFPNGKTALVDGGDKNFSFDAGKRYLEPVLKYYGLSKVNYLIGSHPHSDHIGGFEYILQKYDVDTLVLNELKVESKLYKRIIDRAKEKSVFIKFVNQGNIIIPGIQTRLYVLHPFEISEEMRYSGKNVNNSSIVMKLVYGETSVLLNGDAEVEAESEILNYGEFLDCDILKVGHHGSKTSSTELFITESKPEIAIVSVGANNKFKHPSMETLTKFAHKKIKLLRTDLSGAIVFESNGHRFERVHWR